MTQSPASSGAKPRGQPVRAQLVFAGTIVLVAFRVIAGFVVLTGLTSHSFDYFSKEPAESLDGDLYVGWLARQPTSCSTSGASTTS
jgi:hypothetical protein